MAAGAQRGSLALFSRVCALLPGDMVLRHDIFYGLAGVPRLSAALATGRGSAPANELARRHPHVLNNRVEPLRWAKGAAAAGLPAHAWAAVLADVQRAAGTSAPGADRAPGPGPMHAGGGRAAMQCARAEGLGCATTGVGMSGPERGEQPGADAAPSEAGAAGAEGHVGVVRPGDAAMAAFGGKHGTRECSYLREHDIPVVRGRRLRFLGAPRRRKLFDAHGRALARDRKGGAGAAVQERTPRPMRMP
jgi:hypothetical protein